MGEHLHTAVGQRKGVCVCVDGRHLHTAVGQGERVCVCVDESTYTLLSVRESVSASLDMLCCSLSLALVTGARAQPRLI